MRKAFAISLMFVVAVLGMPVGTFAAAAKAPAVRQVQTTGTIQGEARDEQQKKLAGVRVQVRGLNGQLVATGTTNAAGEFSFAGLNPGSYTIELVDAAGNIVGTSAAITVTAGATATVTVTATAAGAIAAAGGGGMRLFGLGHLATVVVIGAAGALVVAGIVASRNDASPSR